MSTTVDVHRVVHTHGDRNDYYGDVVSDTLNSLSEYFIEPGRISFDQTSKSLASQGSFGDVKQGFLAADTQGVSPKIPTRCTPVAVKVLRTADNIHLDDLKRRLTREAHVLSKIKHKNIVQLLGFNLSKEPPSACLVYPWMSHGDSRSFVAKQTPVLKKRIQLMIDAAQGLKYLHSRKPPIRHGDIKAVNLLVNDRLDGEICDFGLALILQDPAFLPLATLSKSDFQGTIRWCSPEALDEKRGIEADVWAWAWMAWELLTGCIPYQSITSNMQIIIQIVSKDSKPDVEWPPGTAPSLIALIERCWERDPSQRITISDVLEELRQIVIGGELDTNLSPSASPATTLASSPNLDETASLLSLKRSYSAVPRSSGSASEPSTPRRLRALSPHDKGWLDQGFSVLKIFKRCCCLCTAPRRVPRTTLFIGDDPPDPGTEVDTAVIGPIGASDVVSSSNVQELLEPAAGIHDRFEDSSHEDGGAQTSISNYYHLPPDPSLVSEPYQRGWTQKFYYGEEAVAAKPLPIPWNHRLRNTGVLLPAKVNSEYLLNEYITERKTLNHDRIQWLLGYTVINETPFILTPWQANGNIREHLNRQENGVSLADRMDKVAQIAEGIAYLHRQYPPVIHSDLRMENILIDSNGNVVITDIGIFKFLHDHQLSTYGHPEDVRRLAPELWCGGTFTSASDCYAFGCLALEIVTGTKPFHGVTLDSDVVRSVCRGESISPGDYPELANEAPLWQLLEKLWARDPCERLSMAEAVSQIKDVIQALNYEHAPFLEPAWDIASPGLHNDGGPILQENVQAVTVDPEDLPSQESRWEVVVEESQKREFDLTRPDLTPSQPAIDSTHPSRQDGRRRDRIPRPPAAHHKVPTPAPLSPDAPETGVSNDLCDQPTSESGPDQDHGPVDSGRQVIPAQITQAGLVDDSASSWSVQAVVEAIPTPSKATETHASSSNSPNTGSENWWQMLHNRTKRGANAVEVQDHVGGALVWTSSVTFQGRVFVGTGSNKKNARNAAAKAAYDELFPSDV